MLKPTFLSHMFRGNELLKNNRLHLLSPQVLLSTFDIKIFQSWPAWSLLNPQLAVTNWKRIS